ncbi:class I lanthipeptide [Lacinutrix sp. Hel_I_90]|uniref:class I lanthipeptide n=1 Tax=Lacinutrix sp. Hel_I_90 TaxID=1249999 RepID=UPI0005CA80AF|nr:class I lanthipeptide [Lacinutrix sp. Hel_I_90]
MKSQANTRLFLKKQTITELSVKQLIRIKGGSNTMIILNDATSCIPNENHVTTSENTASTILCKN